MLQIQINKVSYNPSTIRITKRMLSHKGYFSNEHSRGDTINMLKQKGENFLKNT